MANLSLKHIYKVYPNGAKAVNDFNMDIRDGEFIVFVGPSGCGKSTTLRMIAGLEAITAGELKIGDTVVNGMEPKDRDIAMVFQNYALYPHMSIFDNLAFGLRTRKVEDIKRDADGNPVLDADGNTIRVMRKYTKAEIAQKVEQAAKVLEITDYLKRKPKEMSGGQRQRVALGRAIVRKPQVMLLDEPLSNLDAKLRTQMRGEIVKLHKKLDTTFIYVTHDQVEAMTMGTRIVVMKDGYVMQIDTPKNLYRYPANKFVAGFIGTPQMNFLQATLKKEGDGVKISFVGTDASMTVPYAALIKTVPSYLDGNTPVYMGVRAEDISFDPQKVKGGAAIKVRVSHCEELGTETLVYGDIDMNGDGFGDSPTRVIVKAGSFAEFEPNSVLEAAIDPEKIHLFDMQTEQTIMPRVPQYNHLDCEVKNGKLSFLGSSVQLPPAISCPDGKGELVLPSAAIALGGDIACKVLSCEQADGQYLAALELVGGRVYALLPSAAVGEITVSIDFKKISIKIGDGEVLPMPEVNGLSGTFVMEKAGRAEKENKVGVRYSLRINGSDIPAPSELCAKMFAATTGRKVFNSEFMYEWSPYAIAFADEGIAAEAVDTLDYGAEKFVKCLVGERELYVKSDVELSGAVHLMPDASQVSVIESERQIRIV